MPYLSLKARLYLSSTHYFWYCNQTLRVGTCTLYPELLIIGVFDDHWRITFLFLTETIWFDPWSKPSRRDGSDEGFNAVLTKHIHSYYQIFPLIWGITNLIHIKVLFSCQVSFTYVHILWCHFLPAALCSVTGVLLVYLATGRQCPVVAFQNLSLHIFLW